MSKFFKALENAERERAASAEPTATAATPAIADPASSDDAADARHSTTLPARPRRDTDASPAPPERTERDTAPPVAPPERRGRPTVRPDAGRDAAPAARRGEPAREAVVPPDRPDPRARETAAPPDRTESTAREAAASVTAPETAPPERASTPAPAETAPAQAKTAPLPPPAPVYGNPFARGSAAHERIFTGVLPPDSTHELGELDDHLVSLLEPTSLAAERYRTVRLHIETLRRERDVRLVAVSSPSRGDGKTLSALNLAGALAQSPDARVALLEADVRHPRMARYLGLPPRPGLSTYLLESSLTGDDVLERPSGVGFAIVVAGPASSMPYELLKSPRLGALLADLRQRFDFVVVDTPPVLPFPDVRIIRDLVDGFLLVVRANRTPREMVRDSLATLGAERVLGVVFNDDERSTVTVSRDAGGWRAVLPRARGAARVA